MPSAMVLHAPATILHSPRVYRSTMTRAYHPMTSNWLANRTRFLFWECHAFRQLLKQGRVTNMFYGDIYDIAGWHSTSEYLAAYVLSLHNKDTPPTTRARICRGNSQRAKLRKSRQRRSQVRQVIVTQLPVMVYDRQHDR